MGEVALNLRACIATVTHASPVNLRMYDLMSLYARRKDWKGLPEIDGISRSLVTDVSKVIVDMCRVVGKCTDSQNSDDISISWRSF